MEIYFRDIVFNFNVLKETFPFDSGYDYLLLKDGKTRVIEEVKLAAFPRIEDVLLKVKYSWRVVVIDSEDWISKEKMPNYAFNKKTTVNQKIFTTTIVLFFDPKIEESDYSYDSDGDLRLGLYVSKSICFIMRYTFKNGVLRFVSGAAYV